MNSTIFLILPINLFQHKDNRTKQIIDSLEKYFKDWLFVN